MVTSVFIVWPHQGRQFDSSMPTIPQQMAGSKQELLGMNTWVIKPGSCTIRCYFTATYVTMQNPTRYTGKQQRHECSEQTHSFWVFSRRSRVPIFGGVSTVKCCPPLPLHRMVAWISTQVGLSSFKQLNFDVEMSLNQARPSCAQGGLKVALHLPSKALVLKLNINIQVLLCSTYNN